MDVSTAKRGMLHIVTQHNGVTNHRRLLNTQLIDDKGEASVSHSVVITKREYEENYN